MDELRLFIVGGPFLEGPYNSKGNPVYSYEIVGGPFLEGPYN